MSEFQQTLGNLEMVVMEQERTIEQLSDLLVDHQAQIDRLQNRIELLEQKLSKYAAGHGEGNEPPEQNEKPPHY
jgi:uncharacterized coiled-coil protein SlyX